MSNSNPPKAGCLGPRSVAFWTVIAGIAAVITLLQSCNPLTIFGPSGDGPGNLPGGTSSAQAPTELVGQWQGSGNQYANDAYIMQIDMTLAPDGGYLIVRDGATQEQGIYAVDGPLIKFRSGIGSQYVWRWAFGNYGARRVLRIQNEGGGIFELQKV